MSISPVITILAAAVCIALDTWTAAQPAQTSSPPIPPQQGPPAQPRASAPGQPGAPLRDPVKPPPAGKRSFAVAPSRSTTARRSVACPRVEPARSSCSRMPGRLAAEALRGLIDAIVLKPADDGTLGIFVEGNLAAMLRLAVHDKRPSEQDSLEQIFPVMMVAGAGFQLYLESA